MSEDESACAAASLGGVRWEMATHMRAPATIASTMNRGNPYLLALSRYAMSPALP